MSAAAAAHQLACGLRLLPTWLAIVMPAAAVAKQQEQQQRKETAQLLRAAFGQARFVELRSAATEYRDGALCAEGLCELFFSLCMADAALLEQADRLLEKLAELCPPPLRPALRDPAVRGRARTAVQSATGLQLTVKSLQRSVELVVAAGEPVAAVRRAVADEFGWETWQTRLLNKGKPVADGPAAAAALAGCTLLHAIRDAKAAPPAPPAAAAVEPVLAPVAQQRNQAGAVADQIEADHLLATALATADAQDAEDAVEHAAAAAREQELEADCEGSEAAEWEEASFDPLPVTTDTRAERAAVHFGPPKPPEWGAEVEGQPRSRVEMGAAIRAEIEQAEFKQAWTGPHHAHAHRRRRHRYRRQN